MNIPFNLFLIALLSTSCVAFNVLPLPLSPLSLSSFPIKQFLTLVQDLQVLSNSNSSLPVRFTSLPVSIRSLDLRGIGMY
jgi:hypothetical protein